MNHNIIILLMELKFAIVLLVGLWFDDLYFCLFEFVCCFCVFGIISLELLKSKSLHVVM